MINITDEKFTNYPFIPSFNQYHENILQAPFNLNERIIKKENVLTKDDVRNAQWTSKQSITEEIENKLIYKVNFIS